MLSTNVMACRSHLPVTLLLALLALGRPAVALAASAPAAEAAPDAAAPPALAAARAELASLAVRIEALKREVAAGRAGRTELQPLLARAQELAATIERLSPPHGVASPAPAGPDAQELHERADALRDRADRLDRTMAQLEQSIGELRRRARLEQSLQTVGGAGDVLADAAPRAVPSARAPAGPTSTQSTSGPGGVATGAGATPGASSGSATPPPSTAGNQPSTPSIAAPSASADAAARALSTPPGREVDPLLPVAGDSLQELLRKRARLHGEASTLRAQADALDAEAARGENVR